MSENTAWMLLFMLPVGELPVCTLHGCFAYLHTCVWSAQRLLQVHLAISVESLIYIFKIGFKSAHRNGAWINLTFFTELSNLSLAVYSGAKYTFLYLTFTEMSVFPKSHWTVTARDIFPHFCLVREWWNGFFPSLCLTQSSLQVRLAL